MANKVLVIIVGYNGIKWMAKCIGSVLGSRAGADVLLVDNGSSDGTPEFVRERFPEVEIVRVAGNPGFGAANNIGLRLALERNYGYAYLLNQDAWLREDTLGTLIGAAEASRGLGVLSPVQLDAHGRPDRQFARKCGKYISASRGTVVEVPFVMAAHWLITREAILRVGGFSPAFSHYGEDDNWLDRLRYHGLKAAVVPGAEAVHDRSERRADRDARMRLKLVSSVVRLSDPGAPFLWRSLVEPFRLAGMSVRNLSSAPLEYIPVLRSRYPELRRLREESKKKRAFL